MAAGNGETAGEAGRGGSRAGGRVVGLAATPSCDGSAGVESSRRGGSGETWLASPPLPSARATFLPPAAFQDGVDGAGGGVLPPDVLVLQPRSRRTPSTGSSRLASLRALARPPCASGAWGRLRRARSGSPGGEFPSDTQWIERVRGEGLAVGRGFSAFPSTQKVTITGWVWDGL